MEPEKFIESLFSPAFACQEKDGIPFAFTMAQAALESGWGESSLFKEAKNIFGVKADRSWKGHVLEIPTREFLKGEWVTILRAAWRKYPDYEECIRDHAKFFKENPRYATALKYPEDAVMFALETAKAGYATDPDYARKLIFIMKKYGLLEYTLCTPD